MGLLDINDDDDGPADDPYLYVLPPPPSPLKPSDDGKLRDRKGKVLHEMKEVLDEIAERLHIYGDNRDRRAMEVAMRQLAHALKGGDGAWRLDETDLDEISRYIQMTKYEDELRRKGYSQAEIDAKIQRLDEEKWQADAAQRRYEEWEAWGDRERPTED